MADIIFPNDTPDVTPVGNDRVLISQTGSGGAIGDAAISDFPISTATSIALGLKVDKTTTVNGYNLSTNITLTKTDVGLGNVDNVQQIPLSYLDTDGTLAANSDSKVATQKATKTYVDTQVASATIPDATTLVKGKLKLAGDLSGTADSPTVPGLANKVDSNVAIVGATKTKITYDSKGLVTAGADATTADIADSTNKRYVTDAQLTVIGNTSGTNTGDQTITLTGDVTGSGTGSFATTLANTAVTPGSYTSANITVDSKGRITAASNGSGGSLTWGSSITGTSGTGILTTVGSNASSGTIGQQITLANAQIQALTAFKIDTGTQQVDHNSLYITGTQHSIYIGDTIVPPSVTTNKLYSSSGVLYWNGFNLQSGLAWGDVAQGTTGTGLALNVYGSATQATGSHTILDMSLNYNTNSAYSVKGISLINNNNAGAGRNTGFYLNNLSSNADIGNNIGMGFVISDASFDGCAMSLHYTRSNSALSTHGLLHLKIDSGNAASKSLYIDTGTGAYDNNSLYITGTRHSIYMSDSDQAPGTTTNKLYAVGGALYWAGTNLLTGGGLSWLSSITGTSGTGITSTIGNSASAGTIGQSIVAGNTQTNAVTLLNLDNGTSDTRKACIKANSTYTGGGATVMINYYDSATQQVANSPWGLAIGYQANTNSSVDFTSINLINQNNSGSGKNTGMRITNNSTEYAVGDVAGQVIIQNGAGGTASHIYGGDNVNSGTNGLINCTLSNTQSGASILSKLDTGTSAQAHIGQLINLYNASTSAYGTKYDTSTTGTGIPIYLSTGGTGRKAIKFDTGFTSTTAPVGASKYIIIDIGGTEYRLLAQATS